MTSKAILFDSQSSAIVIVIICVLNQLVGMKSTNVGVNSRITDRNNCKGYLHQILIRYPGIWTKRISLSVPPVSGEQDVHLYQH